MDTKILHTEEPVVLIDDEIPCHTGEYSYRWDNNESLIDVPDDMEGHTWYPCAWIERIAEGKSFSDIDELVQKIVSRRIDRKDAALKVDHNLDKLLHIRLGLDLILGEWLTHFKKKKEANLGYSTIGTFTVEHLSFSGRLASEMMHNYEVLSNLPLTKSAYLQGEIIKSALRHISRVLTPDNEAEWIEKAQTLSMNALEKAVKKAILETASTESASMKSASPESAPTEKDAAVDEDGNDSNSNTGITQCAPDIPSEESDEERKGVMMHFQVSHKLAPVWDFALQHFRDKEHYNGPLSAFVEALCANFIASGNRAPISQISADDAGNADLPIFYRCHMKQEKNQRRFSIMDTSFEDELHRMPWLIYFPQSFKEVPDDVDATARGLIKLASMRQFLDVAMGKLLWAMKDWMLHRLFDCCHIEEYGMKRCDLSKPLVYRLMKLADGFRKHPLIRKAFKNGLISKEQARMILPIVKEKNEKVWIAYASQVPTSTLKEEVERIARIMEYDCFAAGSYNILPGFRYITDDRFHELPEEMQDIIREGSWYRGPSMNTSWPLEEDDEHGVEERDRRLEEPWKYFNDVDELMAYGAEVDEKKNKSSECATEQGREITCKNTSPALCATDIPSAKNTTSREMASSDSIHYDADILSKAREICAMPHDANPAETFLMDILAEGSGSSKGASTMSIRFFLPEELHELWNTTVMSYLHMITAAETMNTKPVNTESTDREAMHKDVVCAEDILAFPLHYIGYAETFLAALLQDYLFTERIHLKIGHHYAILKRDHFQCQVPGCRCRRNLQVHHIVWRSKGGGDWHCNLITLCARHHKHILHDLLTLKIEGTAPHNLTFTFDAHPGKNKTPFLVYKNGRKLLGCTV